MKTGRGTRCDGGGPLRPGSVGEKRDVVCVIIMYGCARAEPPELELGRCGGRHASARKETASHVRAVLNSSHPRPSPRQRRGTYYNFLSFSSPSLRRGALTQLLIHNNVQQVHSSAVA